MNLDYLAGFIDGEGTIGFEKSPGRYVPYISISNTNLDVLEKIKNFLQEEGINSKLDARKQRNERWAVSYVLLIRWQYAVKLASKLKERLVIKRKQAELLADVYPVITPRNGKYTEEMILKKINLINEFTFLNSRHPQKCGLEKLSLIDLETWKQATGRKAKATVND